MGYGTSHVSSKGSPWIWRGIAASAHGVPLHLVLSPASLEEPINVKYHIKRESTNASYCDHLGNCAAADRPLGQLRDNRTAATRPPALAAHLPVLCHHMAVLVGHRTPHAPRRSARWLPKLLWAAVTD